MTPTHCPHCGRPTTRRITDRPKLAKLARQCLTEGVPRVAYLLGISNGALYQRLHRAGIRLRGVNRIKLIKENK